MPSTIKDTDQTLATYLDFVNFSENLWFQRGMSHVKLENSL